jgi:hypothetical protein
MTRLKSEKRALASRQRQLPLLDALNLCPKTTDVRSRRFVHKAIALMTSLILCEGVACESSDSCSDHMVFATSKSFLERIDCVYPDLLVPVPLPVRGLASDENQDFHRFPRMAQK